LGGDDITAASLTSNVVSLTVTGHGLGFQTYATATADPTGSNNEIDLTASVAGDEFNGFEVLFFVGLGPGSPTQFSLASSSRLVVIISSTATAQEIVTAINGSAFASSYIGATNASGSDGSGVFLAFGSLTATLGNAFGGPSWLEVKGLGFVTTDPNGRFLVTPTDANTITYELTGGDETFTIAGSDDKIITTINDGAVSAIYGSCLFSDPSSSLDESVILATNLEAKKVSLQDYTTTSIPYPSTLEVSEPVEMIQAFDRVFLFRDGQRAWEWIPSGKLIDEASYEASSGIVSMKIRLHGLSTGDGITVSDVGFATKDPNGTHTVSTVVDADNFEYVLTSGGSDENYTDNTGTLIADGFTEVPGGPYTAKQAFSIAADKVDVVDGVLTAEVIGNTTIKAGDFVFIHFTEIEPLAHLQGGRYEVIEASETEIKIPVAAGDYAGTGSDRFDFSGRFSVGGGFGHMPSPPWATYFQRRLWIPYWYDNSGTNDSPTYTDRERRDEIMASDILDANTYDQIYNQFRITAGIADYTVAMHPFFDDFLAVFNRNSIHLIRGTQGTLQDTVVTELTREVGCLARKSVISKGNAVFFLSDNGVYAVEFVDEYNLRGAEEPLSKNIQPYIDRINKDLASESVGAFFNNRYWLAVPLDSAKGAGDAVGNNAILVFNTLNKAWESIDTYNIPQFNIKNLIIGQSGKRNLLFIVNETGGLHEVDARSQPIDVYSINSIGDETQSPVEYELVSRGYMLGGTNYERKKFMRAQVQVQSDSDASDLGFYFSSEDPDTDKFLVTTINEMIGEELPSNETGNFRMRLGNPRGLYGTLTISSSSVGSSPTGRPKVNSITLDGTITNRQTISQF
jgi:hypothetical protein